MIGSLSVARASWAVGALLSLSAGVAAAQSARATIPDIAAACVQSPGLEACAHALREQLATPGLSVAVADRRGLRTAVAGYADVESGQAMTPRSRFLAGSVGKTFVSALALALVEDEEVELDEPIARWVGQETWFRALPSRERLTLRLLMSHRSGLPSYQNPVFERQVLPQLSEADHGHRPDDVLIALRGLPPRFEPGDGWFYTDTAFIVAALTLEAASGNEYYRQVERRFLEPLQLRDTEPQRGVSFARLAQGYVPGLGPWVDPEGGPFLTVIDGQGRMLVDGRLEADPVFEFGGGGFVSSPSDLARWARAFYGGKLFSSETQAELRRGAVDIAGLGETLTRGHPLSGVRYGLGVYLLDTELGEMLGHWGVFVAYRTAVGYFPEHDLAVALAANSSGEVLFDALLEVAAGVVARDRPRGSE